MQRAFSWARNAILFLCGTQTDMSSRLMGNVCESAEENFAENLVKGLEFEKFLIHECSNFKKT